MPKTTREDLEGLGHAELVQRFLDMEGKLRDDICEMSNDYETMIGDRDRKILAETSERTKAQRAEREMLANLTAAQATCTAQLEELRGFRARAAAAEDGRPSFEQIYMDFAHAVARRSTCARTSAEGQPMRVGCVIVSPDWRKVISLGYNGNASGLSNRCDSDQPGACGCLHGEENAIINCDAPRGTPKIVFCTHQPCKMCAKRLVNLGDVEKVYYRESYRLREGLDVLEEAGVYVARLW